MTAVKIDYVNTGIAGFDQALSQLGRKTLIRRAVTVPAMRALQPVRAELKERSKRTHPRSLRRPATAGGSTGSSRQNRRIGPMSRYVSIRGISARSESVGARLFYDTRKFPSFVVSSKSGKRAFYPAAQEYGAANARPPIPQRNQMRTSAEVAGNTARSLFNQKFGENYEKIAGQVLRNNGV